MWVGECGVHRRRTLTGFKPPVWESPYRVVKVTCESLWGVRSRWDQVGPGGSRWVRVGMVGKPSGRTGQSCRWVVSDVEDHLLGKGHIILHTPLNII